VLEPHGAEIVGEASDGGTCVERVVDAQRDLALLDLSMPRVHGLAALPELRRRYTGRQGGRPNYGAGGGSRAGNDAS
jgi:CheY-like chemotaxis protein